MPRDNQRPVPLAAEKFLPLFNQIHLLNRGIAEIHELSGQRDRVYGFAVSFRIQIHAVAIYRDGNIPLINRQQRLENRNQLLQAEEFHPLDMGKHFPQVIVGQVRQPRLQRVVTDIADFHCDSPFQHFSDLLKRRSRIFSYVRLPASAEGWHHLFRHTMADWRSHHTAVILSLAKLPSSNEPEENAISRPLLAHITFFYATID